jgi:hypothetical protein
MKLHNKFKSPFGMHLNGNKVKGVVMKKKFEDVRAKVQFAAGGKNGLPEIPPRPPFAKGIWGIFWA